MSQWKQGGFEEWLRHQEASAWLETLAEEDEELKARCGPVSLTERLTTKMLVALGQMLHEAMAAEPGPEQRKAVLSVAAQLAKVRRGEIAAERARLERERWEAKEKEIREKKEKEAEVWAGLEPYLSPILVDGGRDYLSPRKPLITPGLLEVIEANNRLRVAHEKAQAEANQGKSNQIKPDQGGETGTPAQRELRPPGRCPVASSRQLKNKEPGRFLLKTHIRSETSVGGTYHGRHGARQRSRRGGTGDESAT